ncbi:MULTISPECIES: hypothetical protein [Microcoleaceae]|uniref:hypothetical protein n=1 Tax=Tychonema sp. LEGE 06208 TaxID=1828663 RepID=UPI001D159190|nr:hypothetical protein [Tychonema sp. LEGE 06208]
MRKCKLKGYTVNLIYFWLQSPELAVYRVRRRVESGGHNIPEDVIRRRYERGRKNLLELYLPLSDMWVSYDNSNPIPELIAECPLNSNPIIYQSQIWNTITQED